MKILCKLNSIDASSLQSVRFTTGSMILGTPDAPATFVALDNVVINVVPEPSMLSLLVAVGTSAVFCIVLNIKRMKLLPLVLLASAMFAYAAKAPDDDAELTRRTVGTWVTDPASKSQVVSTATYNADGTGTESVSVKGQPESASIRITTKWSIKDSILSLKCVTSSDPKRVPAGLELKDRIISISEDRFVFEAYEGYGDSKGKHEVKLKQKK